MTHIRFVNFGYHPLAQDEFNAIFNSGVDPLVRCLALATQRNDRIFDGSEPLQRYEYHGPGASHSALYSVEFDAWPLSWVEYVYEWSGQNVSVVAIDAWRLWTRVGNWGGTTAHNRALGRSS